MKWVSRTHVGNVRPTNQDTVILGQNLYGVADGMGGHLAGDIASRMTGELLTEALKGLQPRTDTLTQCISDINAQVFSRQLTDETLRGMGTTLTVMWEGPESVFLAHIGDSRAYLLRNGDFRQITRDHSMVAELVREGLLTEEEAAVHPYRHMITRAVGTDPAVEADVEAVDKVPGDRWLLCSDGLSGCVPNAEMAEILAQYSLQEAADRLLQLALTRGGQDNITLVLTEVEA
ncbi:MAG: Stp1/IreP family PP2C-type Ser/Thr phosphatase [Clostridia bacterium]|nr:Stp1/IreP family PP2C-type Ser/Thr phosphatase [Clostridia bacterium]